MALTQEPPSARRSRTRSPSYPYIALPAALEKAAALWQAEGRHAVAVSVAMQHWGYKEDSSTGYSCVAALKKFGLVDHEGMGDGRQIRLSALALAVLLDKDPASPERQEALWTAALAPRIHAELWERYGAELPSGQSLKRFLVLERNFNETAVDELLDEYRQSMAFAGLGIGGVAVAAPAVLIDRRPEPPPNAPRPALRPAAPPPKASVQPSLFGGEDAAEPPAAPAAVVREETLAPLGTRPPEAVREGAPWSMARRELPVPLDNDLVARVPYPMSEEDFALLIDTLQLWKKRLVQPGR